MSEKTLHKKVVILRNGVRIQRIIQRIKFDNSRNQPTNVRGLAFYNGTIHKVVPASVEYVYPNIPEWKVIE